MNSLCFYLSEKVFTFPSFLKDSFAGYRILGWQFFLPIFWMYHPILSWCEKFLLRNPLIILWSFLVYKFSLFSCCFQNYFFVFDFWQFNYNVSQHSLIQIQPPWGPLVLMDLDVHFSPKVWEVFSHYYFKYTFCSFLLLFSRNSCNANIVSFHCVP